MAGTLRRGLVAGAAGTFALDLVTNTDMAARGRAASGVPGRTVEGVVEALGGSIPGSGDERTNRLSALGALGGMAAGVGTGVAASALRALGLRPGPLTGALVTGLGAMAATDLPAAAVGVSDPRTWSTADWVSDLGPHLVYGLATDQVLRSLEAHDPQAPRVRPSAGLLTRCFAVGVATGGRSSIGVAGAALGAESAGWPRRLAALGAVGSELVADKRPETPSRTDTPGIQMRMASGAAGAMVLAGREGATTGLPALVASAGALAGTFGGLAWREQWSTMPPRQAALLEDGVALALGAWALRRTPRAKALRRP